MSVVRIPAALSTLTLNGYIFADFDKGDYLELNPVNEHTSRNNAANGTTVAPRCDANEHDLVVRVQKYGADDVFLNNAMNQAAPTIFEGSLKENFERDGVSFVGTWRLSTGSITVKPGDTRNNVDGNAMREYTIRFRDAVRFL